LIWDSLDMGYEIPMNMIWNIYIYIHWYGDMNLNLIWNFHWNIMHWYSWEYWRDSLGTSINGVYIIIWSILMISWDSSGYDFYIG
jgi:hypothetical protein